MVATQPLIVGILQWWGDAIKLVFGTTPFIDGR